MSTYQIEEERGVFVVTRTEPRIIGQFVEAEHARLFLAALAVKRPNRRTNK